MTPKIFLHVPQNLLKISLANNFKDINKIFFTRTFLISKHTLKIKSKMPNINKTKVRYTILKTKRTNATIIAKEDVISRNM